MRSSLHRMRGLHGRFEAVPLALLALLSVGCGSVKTSNLPGGGYHIRCDKGMDDCVARAGKICDEGYTVLSGHSHLKILGGPNSSYRMATSRAELEIVCGDVEEEEEEQCISFPSRQQESENDPMRPSAGGNQQCVPGATQRCVGPGACKGGQTCRADGSGFGPCDCGNIRPRPAGDPDSPSGPQEQPPKEETEEKPPKEPESGSKDDTPPSPAPGSKEKVPKKPKIPGATPEPTPLER